MVLKRIISCLAIISVVFLMSCYDVSYDKDDGAAEGNWWDGYTTEQAVSAMDIRANITSASKGDSENIEISWAFPHNLDLGLSSWTIYVQSTNIIDGKPSLFEEVTEGEIIRSEKDDEVLYTYKVLCFEKEQKIITYKVQMTDLSEPDPLKRKKYDNIVSFVVYPQEVTLRITSLASERKSPAELFGYWRTKWYDICRRELNFNVDIDYKFPEEEPLQPLSHVNFKIKSYHSFGESEHWSNSSYCKVDKLETPSAGALATLLYRFEDLPADRQDQEPTGLFDFNDVVFKVDVMKKITTNK